MKRIKFISLALLSLFVFAGCNTNDTPSNEGGEEQGGPTNKESEARTIYKKFIGTVWERKDKSPDNSVPDRISFADDSISFDNKQYSFDQEKLGIITDKYQTYRHFYFIYYDYKIDCKIDPSQSIENILEKGFSEEFDSRITYYFYSGTSFSGSETYYYVSSPTSGGTSENTSAVDGTYEFTASGNREIDGSFTLSDGTWTYSGSKTNMAAQNGTYTVDGSKVTVQWTMTGGIEVEEIFTVSVNGSSAQWTLDDGMNSTFFNMLFGVAAQTELTFSYSE